MPQPTIDPFGRGNGLATLLAHRQLAQISMVGQYAAAANSTSRPVPNLWRAALWCGDGRLRRSRSVTGMSSATVAAPVEKALIHGVSDLCS